MRRMQVRDVFQNGKFLFRAKRNVSKIFVSGWYVFRMVCVQVGCVQDGMCSGWHMFRIACVQDDMCSGWDTFRMACVQDGISSGWDVFRMGCVQDGMCSG